MTVKKNLVPIKSLINYNSCCEDSDYHIDPAYSILEGYEDGGDPDWGGSGSFELNIRIKYCPKCGRKLLVDFIDTASYLVDHHLDYILKNTDAYS